MPKRCKVVGYLLSVRKLNSGGPGEILGKFDGSSDIGDVLVSLIGKSNKTTKNRLTGRATRLELKNNNIRRIQGLSFSGDYGFSSDIFDTSSNTISYKKKKSDADLHPLFFYVATNAKERHGIVCMQQFGTAGMKHIFEDILLEKFNTAYPDYRMHLKSLTIADALESYIKSGQVEELTIEKHEIPADIADKVAGKKKFFPAYLVILLSQLALPHSSRNRVYWPT